MFLRSLFAKFKKKLYNNVESKDKTMQLKKFDILVQGAGQKQPHEVTGVQAINEQQLRQLYAMNDERILKIRNVYDGDSVKDNSTNPEYKSKPDEIPQEALSTDNTPNPLNINPVPNKQVYIDKPNKFPQQDSTPKYYKIGEIEIKEVNGRIYQKQWVALDIKEMKNYRLISDKTNKIISMSGKHIEYKKWIEVSDTSSKEQELLND